MKLVAGELEEGERLAGFALAYGTRVWADVALQMYGASIAFMRFFQGRLEELAAVLDAGMQQHPQPVWRAAAAWAHAELGHGREADGPRASSTFSWPRDFAAMPPDGNWPAGISLLAQAAHQPGRD